MFCKQCGKELKGDSKFCDGCGSKVDNVNSEAQKPSPPMESQNQPISSQENVNPSVTITQYMNDFIKKQSVYVTAIDFINGVKPLKFRIWIGMICGIILAIPTSGVGLIFGFPLGWLFGGIFGSTFKIISTNKKKFPLNKEVDYEDLTLFLRNNLLDFPFTDWKTGTPSKLGLTDKTVQVIECTFEGKTKHRIVFPIDKEYYKDTNWYKVICSNTTVKSFWQHGGDVSQPLMYKNAYKTQPILQAAVEYYLTYVKD